jgi:hypothetical protein
MHIETKTTRWLFPSPPTQSQPPPTQSQPPPTQSQPPPTQSQPPPPRRFADELRELNQKHTNELRELEAKIYKKKLEDNIKRYKDTLGFSQPTFSKFSYDLRLLSSAELKDIAKFHDIKGYYKMDKCTLRHELEKLYKTKYPNQ